MMEGATAQIGASAGIALADTTNVSLNELTATADAALYEAKRGGGGTFCLLSPWTIFRGG